MKAIRPPPAAKVTVSYWIPVRMLDSVAAAMKRQGVSDRRRSRWIEGAIERLLDGPSPAELAAEGFVEPHTGVLIPITLRTATRRRIDGLLTDAPEDLRRRIWLSAVIRAAITQRLLGDGYAQQKTF